MEPLLDKIARQKIIRMFFTVIQTCDRWADKLGPILIKIFCAMGFSIANFARNETRVRLVLIAGACLCLVQGVYWIAQDIVYDVENDGVLLIIKRLAFLPLIAMAPCYKNGKIVYAFIGVLEAFIIFMGLTLTLR